MYIFRIIYQYFEENYFSSSLNANYENLHFTRTATTLLMLVGGLCLGILIASFVAVFERRIVGKFVRGLLDKNARDPESALSLADLGLENNTFIKREMSRASVSRKLVSVVDADGTVRDYTAELSEAFPEFAERVNAERTAKNPSDEGEMAVGGPLPTPDAETDAVTDSAPVPEEELLPSEDREEEATDGDAPKQKGFARIKDAVKGFFGGKKFKPRAIDFATARFFIPEDLVYRAELRFRKKGSSPWLLVLATLLVLAVFFLALRFIPAFVNMLDLSISNIKGK